MKKYLFYGLSLWLVSACGTDEAPNTKQLIAEKNVEGLRARQASLVAQNNTLKKELNLVMEAIDRLDTDKKKSLITVLSLKEVLFTIRLCIHFWLCRCSFYHLTRMVVENGKAMDILFELFAGCGWHIGWY